MVIQGVKEVPECVKCGYIVIPDATKCPSCGTAYGNNEAGKIVNNAYPSKLRIREAGIEVTVAYYQFICPRHGKVNVRATVMAPAIRCPFC